MSSPIPITTPPSNGHPTLDKLPNSPSSTMSISPQTPFLNPPGQAGVSGNTNATSQPNTNNGMFSKWSGLLKSPGTQAKSGFDLPVVAPEVFTDDNSHHNHHYDHDHEHEHHDSFEIGDFGDMKAKSWTAHSRRAASMSLPAGHTGPGQMAGIGPGGGGGKVMSMLSGFGAAPTSAPGSVPNSMETSAAPTLNVGSPLSPSLIAGGLPNFQGGVLADKAAKAQGALRRLSIGGGFAKPSLFSPPSTNAQLLPSPPKVPNTLPVAVNKQNGTTAPPENLQPPSFARGRRFSEGGSKKRGVSPMGERMLREHGHF